MTTLQLAEKIARAVLHEVDNDETWLAPHDEYFTDSPRHDMAMCVLRVLRDNNSWLCRLTLDANGDDIGQQPYELIQQELFS